MRMSGRLTPIDLVRMSTSFTPGRGSGSSTSSSASTPPGLRTITVFMRASGQPADGETDRRPEQHVLDAGMLPAPVEAVNFCDGIGRDHEYRRSDERADARVVSRN